MEDYQILYLVISILSLMVSFGMLIAYISSRDK